MKSWDVIVIGSGAAGFAAAVTACCKGLSVLMLEKAGQFGGTSAISGGAVWLHDTDQARAEGKSGSAEAMKTYLRTIIGEGQYREDLAEAFVSAGREALAFLEREGAVKYSLRPLSPDYYPDEPGAVDVGRALEVVEYDGRELGDAFRDLRSPPPGMLLFGGMMVNRVDIQHFLDMRRSLRSLAHCTRLLLRYARDRVKYPRGTRLAMGNALIARMATTALRKGMNLRLNVEVGAATYWSELMQVQTLDNLFAKGVLSDAVTYLENMPRGYIPGRQELIDALITADQAERLRAREQDG